MLERERREEREEEREREGTENEGGRGGKKHVQASTSGTRVYEGGCRPSTHSSLGLLFRSFTFCRKLVESVCCDCHHLRQSSEIVISTCMLLPPLTQLVF